MSTTSNVSGAGTASSTVMVVEPDILIRMVIADYLRDCGYRVIEGVTAHDVFAVLRTDEIVNIIFAGMDVGADMDGFQLARWVREFYPAIDVILTAGPANAANKASALCGAGPLEKSSHPQEVLRRINMLRERHKTAGDTASHENPIKDVRA